MSSCVGAWPVLRREFVGPSRGAAVRSEHPNTEVFQIDVVRSRDVSDAVEKLLGVRHQSPQVFLVRRGTLAWTASHWSITAYALERELGSAHESG